jgi:hypothetical protein
MSAIYYILDQDGFYVSHNYYFQIPEGNVTDVPITQSFVRAKFNGQNWEEGGVSQDLIAAYTDRIQQAFTFLRRRALSSSINKTGDWDYIFEQAEQYKIKYRVAKGEITNVAVQELIADEANDFGVTVEQMNALIISMYEAGELAYNKFTAMIERARTKALTMLEIGSYARALEIIELMESVPEQLTMEQAQVLTAQMIAI